MPSINLQSTGSSTKAPDPQYSSKVTIHPVGGGPTASAVPQLLNSHQTPLTLVKPPEPHLEHIFNAHLPLLPEPLKLNHGPLLVIMKAWSDAKVQAELPVCGLYGQGDDEAAALQDLADNIKDFAHYTVHKARAGGIAGPLKRHWAAFVALVDVSDLAL
jgi:hypothetical protein